MAMTDRRRVVGHEASRVIPRCKCGNDQQCDDSIAVCGLHGRSIWRKVRWFLAEFRSGIGDFFLVHREPRAFGLMLRFCCSKF